MNSSDPCSICLSDITNIAKPVNCDHTFCEACILAWSRIKCVCPYCRTRMTVIQTSFNGREYTQEQRVMTESEREKQIRFEYLVEQMGRSMQYRNGNTILRIYRDRNNVLRYYEW